jgi:hypothetical protein
MSSEIIPIWFRNFREGPELIMEGYYNYRAELQLLRRGREGNRWDCAKMGCGSDGGKAHACDFAVEVEGVYVGHA